MRPERPPSHLSPFYGIGIHIHGGPFAGTSPATGPHRHFQEALAGTSFFLQAEACRSDSSQGCGSTSASPQGGRGTEAQGQPRGALIRAGFKRSPWLGCWQQRGDPSCWEERGACSPGPRPVAEAGSAPPTILKLFCSPGLSTSAACWTSTSGVLQAPQAPQKGPPPCPLPPREAE